MENVSKTGVNLTVVHLKENQEYCRNKDYEKRWEPELGIRKDCREGYWSRHSSAFCYHPLSCQCWKLNQRACSLVRLLQIVEMTFYPFVSSSSQLKNHKKKISPHPLREMTTKFTKNACTDIVSAFFRDSTLLPSPHILILPCLLFFLSPNGDYAYSHSSLDAGSLPSSCSFYSSLLR